jgi:hypothetical protein
MEAHPAEERLETALKRVVETLPHATPRQKALLYKRGGDICVGLDAQRKALGWYGRAVDQLLELGDHEEAARMCRLIIYVQPDAVRARCTLSWIDIGAGMEEAAMEHVVSYAHTARQANQTELLTKQLGWMFEATTSPPLRRQIIAELRTLDHPDAIALAERLQVSPPPPLDREHLWARVLGCTIGAHAPRAGGR